MASFDKRAATWDSSATRQNLAKEIASTVVTAIPLHHTMHLLDFGAGTGLLTQHITPHVARITALDISQKMLSQLQENALSWHDCHVKTVHADICSFHSDTLFDGIISSMSMHHIEDIDALFSTFASLLKPKGFIAIADLQKEDGGFHDHGNEGVFHFGFEEEYLSIAASKYGFEMIDFTQATVIQKEDNRQFPIFLMSAYKG